jgi:hypothetical protein
MPLTEKYITKDIAMSDTTNENKPADLMGYEEQIAPEITLPETSNAEDIQSLINRTVKEVTVDDNGKYVYPENMDPVLKAAVAATKSYRDNQSGFTKSQQSLKESEAEVKALQSKLAKFTSKSLELTPEDRQELDNLKTSDPEQWRVKLNQLELEAKDTIKEEIDSATEEARETASGEFELQRRYDYLDQFNEGREVKITPELLDTDVPPRITKKLAESEITFEVYLDEVAEYLLKGKTVAKAEVEKTTDLNKLNGSSEASEDAKDKQGEIDYSNMVF